MITFTSIASSSAGNAYIVGAEGLTPLLLEAGIPIKKLREAFKFGLSGIAGCLISHEHGDHSKAVKDLLKSGVDCYMTSGTAGALGVADHHRVSMVGKMSAFRIGAWTVRPFALEHDAADPCGFLIGHGTDSLLFIPDTAYMEHRFKGVTQIAMECNHIGDLLSENIVSGDVAKTVGHRVRRNHMSLETAIRMLKANDLSRCRAIYLLHLSDTNSDEARMKKDVQEATGIPVTIC